MIPDVDTILSIHTTWRKDTSVIQDSTEGHVLADSVAAQSSSSIHIYESTLGFNPLSKAETGDDSGNYTCSVAIKDGLFITGITANATQDLTIKGKCHTPTLSGSWARFLIIFPLTIIIVDLMPPIVSVTQFGVSTAGENYTLECSVETVEGVRSRDISIAWRTPNGTTRKTQNLTTIGNMTRGRLIFSPLTTSHSGQYVCTGRILAESVGVDASNNSNLTVNVSSKFMLYLSNCVPICMHTVPAPNVSVSDGVHGGPVIQGTELVLSCSVQVSTALNTGFRVQIAWSSVPTGALLGQYANTSETKGSGQIYGSSVTISPVNTSDSATYTCTASALPNEISYVIGSNESKDSVNIAVESK